LVTTALVHVACLDLDAFLKKVPVHIQMTVPLPNYLHTNIRYDLMVLPFHFLFQVSNFSMLWIQLCSWEFRHWIFHNIVLKKKSCVWLFSFRFKLFFHIVCSNFCAHWKIFGHGSFYAHHRNILWTSKILS
jgi:hypothetical protein